MDMTEQLLAVARGYRAVTGLALATIATRAGNDGSLFKRLSSGGSITVRRWEELMRWFAHHWPEGSDFPPELQPYAAGGWSPDLPQPSLDRCDGDRVAEAPE